MARGETTYGKKQTLPKRSTISYEQSTELAHAFGGDEEKIDKTLKHFKVDKLSDIPADKFDELMKKLKK